MPHKQMYIRLRHRLQVQPHQTVQLKDICQFIVDPRLEKTLAEMSIYHVTPLDQTFAVIDVVKVIELIKAQEPEMEIESLGPTQTIIEVTYPRKSPVVVLVILVWILLFVGSGLAIMYFHEDVNMLAVHQKIYTLVTGEKKEHPLLLQIPYSIGVGIGMILFFNHLFKKRFNEEPSPMEVEMFQYQQSIDQYVAMHENREVQKNLDDH